MDVLEAQEDRGAAVDLHPGAGQPVGVHQAHLPAQPQLGPVLRVAARFDFCQSDAQGL